MCQRATGGVSIAFKNVARARVSWQREPDRFASSAIAARGFCRECGTPLTFEYLQGSENIDLTVGSFDSPERFRPTQHFGAESLHEAWLDTSGLPRQRSGDYQPLVERWRQAGVAQPD
jgi:hypothetical protein